MQIQNYSGNLSINFLLLFKEVNAQIQEDGEARWGDIPRLNISVYLQTIFEPHNALVHVSQNFFNFMMYSIYWITAAAVYFRVNPIADNDRSDDYYYDG